EVAIRELGGKDRVLITWTSGSIVNRYLQITMLSNTDSGGDTGLAASSTWYYGNKVGDTFANTNASFFRTSGEDEIAIRGHFGPNAQITNVWDIDRNKVSGQSADQIATRGTNFGPLTRINLGLSAAPEAAPQAAPLTSRGDGSAAAIAARL